MNLGFFGERESYITLQTLQNGVWTNLFVDCGADAYLMYLRSGDTTIRAVRPDGTVIVPLMEMEIEETE